MRIFSWLVMFLVILFFTLFAIANRDVATLYIWPLSLNLAMPLFMVVMISIFVGFLWGALVMWFVGRKRIGSAKKIKVKAGKEIQNSFLTLKKQENLQPSDNETVLLRSDELALEHTFEKDKG